MDAFFQVLGITAGLAGLGLGLFIVIARLVIDSLHHPDPTTDRGISIMIRGKLDLLNRIMRYAFALAVISIAIWAALQVVL